MSHMSKEESFKRVSKNSYHLRLLFKIRVVTDMPDINPSSIGSFVWLELAKRERVPDEPMRCDAGTIR